MVAAVSVLAVVLGGAIGSFVNALAYRVPRGLPVAASRSACPACGAQIRARDNLPLLSYVLLRGHCRDCGSTISARYPIVEATVALLFLAVVAFLGAVWVVPAYWWFVMIVTALVLTDLDHKRIPNRILFPGIAGGAVLLFAGALADGSADGGGWAAIGRAGGGAAIYFGLLLCIALIARGGFGFGDVKLAALLGMFLAYRSWAALWSGIFLAFLLGGLAAVALLVTRRAGRKQAIPFGPALVAGALIAIAYGQDLVDWYLGA